jgi:hypothetical protein
LWVTIITIITNITIIIFDGGEGVSQPIQPEQTKGDSLLTLWSSGDESPARADSATRNIATASTQDTVLHGTYRGVFYKLEAQGLCRCGAVAVARKPMEKSGFLFDVAGSAAAELDGTFGELYQAVVCRGLESWQRIYRD